MENKLINVLQLLVKYIMSLKNKKPCKIWSRYHVTQKNGSIVKLRIQDLEWDTYKYDVIDFIIKYFINDEAFHKAAGIGKNEEAIIEYREILYLLYEKEYPNVMACYIDNDSPNKDIVGISIISDKKSQSDKDKFKDFKPKTKEVENLFNILKTLKDMTASHGCDSFYEGRGISVRPDHRGLGIANEFVRLRKLFCFDNNVQMTSAWMTSIGTQKAADKYNWKTFLEVPIEELGKLTGLTFETNVPKFKLMYTTKD